MKIKINQVSKIREILEDVFGHNYYHKNGSCTSINGYSNFPRYYVVTNNLKKMLKLLRDEETK